MADELAAKHQLSDTTLLREAALVRLAGHHDEAELALRDLVTEHGLTATAANLLALVCGEQGNTRDELHYAEKAASLNPDNATIVGNYACVLAETGKPDQAIAKMRVALHTDPELDYLYERLGDIYRGQGNEEAAQREFTQAIRVLEKKIRVEPHPARRWNDLARLYQKTADYDNAAEAKSRSLDAHLNEVFEGDHRHCIAGPDSGF